MAEAARPLEPVRRGPSEPTRDIDADGFEMVSLARADGPPMRFRGRLRFRASNEDLDRPSYSELAVYERRRGGLVAAVSVRRDALMIDDLHFAQVCPDLDAALEAIEAVDPTQGWREPATLAAHQGAARLLGQVALRLKLERLREDHLQLVERSVTLWGSTPSMLPPPSAASDGPEPAAARMAIRPPRG